MTKPSEALVVRLKEPIDDRSLAIVLTEYEATRILRILGKFGAEGIGGKFDRIFSLEVETQNYIDRINRDVGLPSSSSLYIALLAVLGRGW